AKTALARGSILNFTRSSSTQCQPACCFQRKDFTTGFSRLLRVDHNFSPGNRWSNTGDTVLRLLTCSSNARLRMCLRAPGAGGRRSMAMDARRLKTVENVFGIEAAGLLLADILPPWLQDLNLLVEQVEAGRPSGAPG